MIKYSNPQTEGNLTERYGGGRPRLLLSKALHQVIYFSYNYYRLGRKPPPDFLPEIVVSNRYRFVYCGVPLVGTQTFLDALIRQPSVDFDASLYRQTLPSLLAEFPELRSYLKLAIVRNPWRRTVSCYEKVVRNAYAKGQFFDIRAVKDIGQICLHKGLHPQMSFREFVNWLCSFEGSDEIANRHWMSQHRFLFDRSERCQYDVLLKLEDVDSGLKSVFKKLDVPIVRLPVINTTDSMPIKRQYECYREYYDDITANAVATRYRRDIELFEYEY